MERARGEGSVAISREVPALAGLSAASLALMMAGPWMGRSVMSRLAPMLALNGSQDLTGAVWAALQCTALLAAPVLFGVMAASITGSLLQSGFVAKPTAIMPDLARLSPMRGFKRIFGLSGLVETGKSLVKLGVLGFAVYHVVKAGVPALQGSAFWQPGELVDRMVREVLQLAMTLLGVQAVIAGADVWWVRHRHASELRMTREEVKQDAKEADGNPQIKQRLRSLRMARARKRMMAAVPTATVVVTNPTHYAIALAYDRAKGGAPRVVAKGVDEVAARIREMARENRVPLVANPPLARALFTVELDAEVPAEHFKVVAEIIAYVWRLNRQAGQALGR